MIASKINRTIIKNALFCRPVTPVLEEPLSLQHPMGHLLKTRKRLNECSYYDDE